MKLKQAIRLQVFLFFASTAILTGQPESSPPTHRDLVYSRAQGLELRLDLYLPKASDPPYPVIVWIHGGGWIGGSKDSPRAQRMTKKGYAVASINYRLLFEALFPAQIEDSKTAIRWLRAHADDFGIDTNRIGVWGASAGGHLAALLGTSGDVPQLEGDGDHLEFSSRVQAVCDFYGPTDLLQLPAFSELMGSGFSWLFSRLIADRVFLLNQMNPIHYVTADDPPFLIMHGDKDELVPLTQSQLLADALRNAGIPHRFEVVRGAGHSLRGPQIEEAVDHFFDLNLKGYPVQDPGHEPASTSDRVENTAR